MPVMVTVVPPRLPALGVKLVTVGGATKLKSLALVPVP